MSEQMPLLHAEYARSGRSKCVTCGDLIDDGALRIGTLDFQSGFYGDWHHVNCWIPSAQATEAFSAATTAELVEKELRDHKCKVMSLAADVSDPDLTLLSARLRETLFREAPSNEAPSNEAPSNEAPSPSRKRPPPTPDTVHPAKRQAGPPLTPPLQPIQAVPKALEGLQVVVSGVFPTLGGGVGLNEGKDAVAALLTESGASVKSGLGKGFYAAAADGRAFLLVGDRPGASKVDAAREHRVKRIDLDGLKRLLAGDALSDVGAAIVTNLSDGYQKA